MINIPFFSVVIPVYNVEKYLTECVDSVLKQSFKNYEIILVDDGSPDNCPVICDELSEKHECIKVIHQKNGGLSDARNQGLRNASGEFIVFLDSDDKLASYEVLDTLYNYIKKENCKIIYCPRIARFSDVLKPIFSQSIKTKKLSSTELFSYSITCQSIFTACLFITNRQFLLTNSLFFTKNILHEDMDWIPRLLNVEDELIGIYNEDFYLYRINDSSITSVFTQKRFEGLMYTIKWISEISEISEFLSLWLNMLFYSVFIDMESEYQNRELYKKHLSELKKYMRKESRYLSSRNKIILHLGRVGALVFYKLRGLVR